MNFYDRVYALCRRKGMSINSLTEEIKISRGSPTTWKNNAKPNPKTVKKIADYFGVDVSYFYDDDPSPPIEMQQKKAPAEADAKKEEKEIAEKWDRLSELVQQIPEDKREEFAQLLEIGLKMQGLL